MTHDYTRKGGIAYTEILLPDNAPREYATRAILWNAVEKCERYKTAQLAREFEIALPKELSLRENKSLVRRYVQENFVAAGMCADFCLHDKQDGNPHAHIMLTMRPIEQDGTWGQKSRTENGIKIPTVDWNEQTKAEDWRKAWAAYCNTALQIHGHETRIDHRSYERQGIDLIPTVHLGVAAFQMERRGIATGRGNKNREITELNKRLRQMKARIRRLEDELKEIPAAPPTLLEIFSEMAKQSENRTQKQKIADLQLTAQTLSFIQSHNIETLADLSAAVQDLHAEYNAMHSTVTEMSRRYHTLTEHISQAETYTKHTAVYKRYAELKGDKQDAFFDKHSKEILAFSKAHEYMQRHLNGHPKIPLAEWRREFAELTAKREAMFAKSDKLRQEIQSAEVIKRNAYKVMGVAEPKRNKTRGMEL